MLNQLYLSISQSDFVYLVFNYFMEINLNSTWKSLLDEEINQPYFIDLMNSVENEYSKNTCYPPKELIFSAFDYCSFDNLKVCL